MNEVVPKRNVRWLPVFWISLLASAAICVVWWHFWGLHFYLSWLIGITFVTGVLFAWDKLMAKFGWRRIPERTLLLMNLLGGFVGGWIGQFLFRHKTRKWVFWAVLGASTLLHAAIFWFIWQDTGFR